MEYRLGESIARFIKSVKIQEHMKADGIKQGFKDINKPENLYGDYKYYFCIEVREEMVDDVVELQNYYLIKRYFNQITLILLLEGNKDFYHKASYYFATISGNVQKESDIYNSIFFIGNINGGSEFQRLQTKNIGALKKFMPMQPIDSETLGKLRRPLKEFLSLQRFEQIFSDDCTDVNKDNQLKIEEKGSIAIWGGLKKDINNEQIINIYNKLNNHSILAFHMVSYTLKCVGINKDTELEQILLYIKQSLDYINGIFQLLENIVQHATDGKGVLSIRIHDQKRKEKYLKNKYGDNIKSDIPYLEISVIDYAAENRKGNIADTFRDNLPDNVKKQFELLKPIDFFETPSPDVKGIKEAFWDYFSECEAGERHMGLQLFMHMVSNNDGIFACYSHKEHYRVEGEEYHLNITNESSLVMPGTGYMILLPITGSQSVVTKSEISIDTVCNIEEKVEELIDKYIYREKEIVIDGVWAATPEDKKNIIDSIKEQLYTENISEKTVYYINASDWINEWGEYVCKALLKAGREQKLPDYVFYECEEKFIEIFRQCSAVFFERSFYVAKNLKNDFAIALYSREKMTIFEKYTLSVLEKDIQEQSLGCKITHTHMRLGSTIHINNFYEAELLFSNKLFVNRFAYLLVKKINKDIQEGEAKKLTLYSYALYSELLIFETMTYLKKMYPNMEVDYAILEREAEHRELVHIDCFLQALFGQSCKALASHDQTSHLMLCRHFQLLQYEAWKRKF